MLIRRSDNLKKSIAGNDESHFYPYYLCQDMPTRLFTRWDHLRKTQNSGSKQGKFGFAIFKLCLFHIATETEKKIESYFITGTQKKSVASVLIVFATIVKLFLKKGDVISFLSFQKRDLSWDDSKRGIKKMCELRKDYIRENVFSVDKMWECRLLDHLKNSRRKKSRLN